jgi:diguanylate cyclase (GGDEF)-like protein
MSSMRLEMSTEPPEPPSSTSPLFADFSWNLSIVCSSMVVIPVVLALLPRNEPLGVGWFLAAGVLLLASAGLTGTQMHRVAASSGESLPEQLVLAAMSGLSVLSMGCAAIALGPTTGYARILLLIPVTIVAAYARPVLFNAIAAITAAVFVAVTTIMGLGGPDELASTTALALVGATGITVIRLLLALNLKRTVQDRAIAGIVDASATAVSLSEGLEQALPHVAAFLEADAVAVCTVDAVGQLQIVSSWPVDDERDQPDVVFAVATEVIARATGTRETVFGPGHCVIPLARSSGLPFAALALGTPSRSRNRIGHEYRCRVVGQQLDLLISRVRMIERLEALTRTDSLTGVPNRRALMERLDHEIKVSRRTSEPVTVVMVDLDHFKQFNDTYGHLAGDEALVSVASLLHNRLRTTDLVSRYGGEEFCVVLTRTTDEVARRIVDELRRLVGNIEGPQTLTISAGVAEWDGAETIEDLIARADEALYLAKSAGRDQCRVWGERRQTQPLTTRPLPPNSVSLN